MPWVRFVFSQAGPSWVRFVISCTGRRRWVRFVIFEIRLAYPRKPMLDVGKFPKFGKTVANALDGIPNHEHSVAPYWSIDVVGIQRPRVSVSFGPPSSN